MSLTFDLAITQVSAQYYDRLIQTAENDGASASVIELNTPGGLVDFHAADGAAHPRQPCACYRVVSPQGAMSVSAGCSCTHPCCRHVPQYTTIGSSEVILNAGSSDNGSTPESGDAAPNAAK